MKKILILAFVFTATNFCANVSAAPLQELDEKISISELSMDEKQNCLFALEKSEKTELKNCIEKLKTAKLNDLKRKIQELGNKIQILKNAGADTSPFEEVLRQSNEKLEILSVY